MEYVLFKQIAAGIRGIRDRGLSGFPVLTSALLLACLGFFWHEVQNAGWQPSPQELFDFGAMTSDDVWPPDWRAISLANFLHVDIIHLVNNLVVIWVIGFLLEPLMGFARFGILVLAGGLASSFLTGYLLDPSIVSVGASGIAFAVIAAAVVIDFRAELGLGQVAWQLLFLNSIVTFTMVGVSVGAHVGGAAAGCIIGFASRGHVNRLGHQGAGQMSEQPVFDTSRFSPDVIVTARSGVAYLFMLGFGVMSVFLLPSMFAEGDSRAWLLAACAVFLIPTGIFHFLPGAYSLTITPDGFCTRSAYFRTTHISWKSIDSAWAKSAGFYSGVQFRLKPEFRRPGTLRAHDGDLMSGAWWIEGDQIVNIFEKYCPDAWQPRSERD